MSATATASTARVAPAAAPSEATSQASAAAAEARVTGASPRRAATHPEPIGAAPAGRFAALLDRLRAPRPERPGGTVVVAPASAGTALADAIEELRKEAERAGLRTLVVGMEERARTVTLRASAAEAERQLAACRELPDSLRDGVTWRSMGESGDGKLAAEIAAAAPSHELVVVAGPPLAASPAPAYLARACDGLIIVAQAQRTTKDDLRAACDSARIAGCEVLGIVFAETDHWLTRLLRRL